MRLSTNPKSGCLLQEKRNGAKIRATSRRPLGGGWLDSVDQTFFVTSARKVRTISLGSRKTLRQCLAMRRTEQHPGIASSSSGSDNVTEALAALTFDELRQFAVDAFARLEAGPRAALEDMLLQRAVRGDSGWKPLPPRQGFVEEAKRFANAARHVGQAEAADVDDYLRQAITASLAGGHAEARAVFEALFEPIGNCDIFLGQDEMVDEVLTVDLHECICHYLAAVFVTTPIAERVDAVLRAIATAHELSYIDDPIEDVTTALGQAPPDLDAFLSVWIERLERDATVSGDFESAQERWLRAAVGRRDGVTGLERLARSSKRAEAARAWCNAFVAAGAWDKALLAYETSASFVKETYSRGDFLDGAALAAQMLGRKDLATRIKAAWLGAPSLLRVTRWLLAGEPSPSAIRKRASTALLESPTKAPRIVGFLQILAGDIRGAAQHLAKCDGLGWSSRDHAGHVLFPTFAWLLGGAPVGTVREGLALALHRPLCGEFEYATDFCGASSLEAVPRLKNPAIVEIMQRADAAARMSGDDRAVMLDAMKAAAIRRTDSLLDKRRRRHYEHAATLVACCVEFEGSSGTQVSTSDWAERLRARTSRFPAFQEELRAALAQAQRGTAMA